MTTRRTSGRSSRFWRHTALRLGTICAFTLALATGGQHAETGADLLHEEFESGLAAWEISDPSAIFVVDSRDEDHGKVLEMRPGHAGLHALIRGSEAWGAYRIEGEVLFPTDEHNYLGFIYNYRRSTQRADLGSVYIKGNSSYIRVNPRRDWNPARNLYDEYRVKLENDDAIRIGEWHRFAAEVSGPVCHVYFGDMTTPKVTFEFFEHDSGHAGFKPRVVGGPVWIDNIRSTPIDGLSYDGPRLPAGIRYTPEQLITQWEVLGPFPGTRPMIERSVGPTDVIDDNGQKLRWRDFATDPRGAVVTGQVTEFLGSRTVAYFRTTIEVPEGKEAILEVSTIDDMALWLNGQFEGYANRDRYAWYDFRDGEDDRYAMLLLPAGKNRLLIRVRGGVYASGGFFARVRP